LRALSERTGFPEENLKGYFKGESKGNIEQDIEKTKLTPLERELMRVYFSRPDLRKRIVRALELSEVGSTKKLIPMLKKSLEIEELLKTAPRELGEELLQLSEDVISNEIAQRIVEDIETRVGASLIMEQIKEGSRN